jgi:hypothetical protein
LTGTTANRVEASEATEREIDLAVRDIVEKAFDRATEVLRTRRGDLDEANFGSFACEEESRIFIAAARPVRTTAGAATKASDAAAAWRNRRRRVRRRMVMGVFLGNGRWFGRGLSDAGAWSSRAGLSIDDVRAGRAERCSGVSAGSRPQRHARPAPCAPITARHRPQSKH